MALPFLPPRQAELVKVLEPLPGVFVMLAHVAMPITEPTAAHSAG